ncbi:MAG: exodeoxyribonuclease VII large subunit [Woeseiaceae bacterium]|nr:exodeoxyribonuclease VII large subunit [Woeseiaceae bacterium]
MTTPRDTAAAAAAISVSELNRRARQLLEQGIARLWVEGEISNIARPPSGHVYFSLKDDAAQIRAAYFRQRQRGPTVRLKNGDLVLAYGRVSLYEARGDYQLIVEDIEAAGVGALQREFEKLKLKLQAEGLFDEDRKLPLPALPARVGVITSPSGAAIRDILTVLRRRFAAVPVVLYPAAVQGEAAPDELLAALAAAVRRNECDVLIIGRGGGSLEDLWAFNNEALARAIADCPIPIVSAVGHEIDFTIADFVADVRAPTPTAAAGLVVPDRRDWLQGVAALAGRLARLGRRALDDEAQTLDWLARRLLATSPAATLGRQQNRLRASTGRLAAAMRTGFLERRHRLQRRQQALLQASPALNIERQQGRRRQAAQRLAAALQAQLGRVEQRLRLAARGLSAVSPLATLERGYAVVTDPATGKVVTEASAVAIGDEIRARLRRGELRASVTRVEDDA